MKRIHSMILALATAAAGASLCGCESDDGPDTDAGRPADISGTWAGNKTHSGEMMTTTYQVQMTISQKGTAVSGTYVQASSASTPFDNHDVHSAVAGTYDSATGVFTWGGRRITFIDDNTMFWRDNNAGTQYTTTLHRR